MDGLPNFLTHGAPLARFARLSSAKIVSRQKLYLAGNIASKGKRAIFPANVGLFMLTFTLLVLGSVGKACLSLLLFLN